jgi:DNA primase
MEVETVVKAVATAAGRAGNPFPPVPPPRAAPDANDPRTLVEREALKLALQVPVLAGPVFDSIDATAYVHPVHAAVREAIAEAGGASGSTGGPGWIEAVRDACADLAAKAAVGELAVEPVRVDGEPDPRYVTVQLARLQLYAVSRRIAEVKSRVQRINPVTNQDEHLQLFGELVSLEQHARALRDQASGGL